jgi:hypothetical protein
MVVFLCTLVDYNVFQVIFLKKILWKEIRIYDYYVTYFRRNLLIV